MMQYVFPTIVRHILTMVSCMYAFLTARIVSDGNLSELNVSYCSIESWTTCDLARALYDNSQLQDLWLRGNPVGEAGAEAIASMLQRNYLLKLLDLTGCSSVGQIGVQKLIAVMCQNASLKLLYLPDNLKSSGRATQGYDMVESRIQWARDISTQKEVQLRGSDINSFIGNETESIINYVILHYIDAHILCFPSAEGRGERPPGVHCLFVNATFLPRAYAAGLSDWFCLSVRPSVCPSVVCPLKNRAISRFTGLSDC